MKFIFINLITLACLIGVTSAWAKQVKPKPRAMDFRILGVSNGQLGKPLRNLFITDREDAWLHWTPFPGAKSYEVKTFNESGSFIGQPAQVSGVEFVNISKMAYQNYFYIPFTEYYLVVAINEKGQKIPASNALFKVVQRSEDYTQGTVPKISIDLNLKIGSPIAFGFGPDSKAVIYTAPASNSITLHTTIEDNTCNNVVGAECNVTLDYPYTQYQLRWAQHPDASKLGKVVTIAASYTDGQGNKNNYKIPLKTNSDNYGGSTNFLKEHRPNDVFENITLKCTQYNWLPLQALSKEDPNKIIVSRWLLENEVSNSETGEKQNRAVRGMTDIILMKDGQASDLLLKSKAFRSYKEFLNPNAGFSGFFTPNGVYSLMFLKDDGSTCQVRVKTTTAYRPETAKESVDFQPVTYSLKLSEMYGTGAPLPMILSSWYSQIQSSVPGNGSTIGELQ
jgi:hypothetical protein